MQLLTETSRLGKDIVHTVHMTIDNYTLFRLDRNPKQKRKGGGICFYVKNDVKCRIIKHRNTSEPNLEYMFISCEFASNTYVIACIYHPPKPYYDTGLFVYELCADLDNLLSIYSDCVYTCWYIHTGLLNSGSQRLDYTIVQTFIHYI